MTFLRDIWRTSKTRYFIQQSRFVRIARTKKYTGLHNRFFEYGYGIAMRAKGRPKQPNTNLFRQTMTHVRNNNVVERYEDATIPKDTTR